MDAGPSHDHRKLDKWIGLVLLAGMVLSISIMVLGLLLFAISPSGEEVDLSLEGIANGIGHGDPIAVIDLGIILLILTPLTRVVASLIVFLVDGELKYVAVSLFVLAVIGLAIFIG